MKTHLFFCLLLTLGVSAVAMSREVKTRQDAALQQQSYVVPYSPPPLGYHDSRDPACHVYWWQFRNGILWHNYTATPRLIHQGYRYHPAFRAGRWRDPVYISGGWILPGGKLPDASRPPVGRTRGGQNHPRPVSSWSVPSRQVSRRAVPAPVPRTPQRSTLQRDRGLLVKLFYKLFSVNPRSRWFRTSSGALPSVDDAPLRKTPAPGFESPLLPQADPLPPDTAAEPVEDAANDDAVDGADDNRSGSRSGNGAKASRADSAQEDISTVSPKFVIPEIEKRGSEDAAEKGEIKGEPEAEPEPEEPAEHPDAGPVLPLNDIPQHAPELEPPDDEPANQLEVPADSKGESTIKENLSERLSDHLSV